MSVSLSVCPLARRKYCIGHRSPLKQPEKNEGGPRSEQSLIEPREGRTRVSFRQFPPQKMQSFLQIRARDGHSALHKGPPVMRMTWIPGRGGCGDIDGDKICHVSIPIDDEKTTTDLFDDRQG